MASYNEICLIGHAGQDAELKYLANGNPLCNFSIAVSNNKKVGDEWKENTIWFRASVFGDRAERVAEDIHKGNMVFVKGRLEPNVLETKDGEKRTDLNVICSTVMGLERRERSDGGQRKASGSPSGAKASAKPRTQPESLPWE